MAELADALDSGSNFRKEVEVQVLLPAPNKAENEPFSALFFAFSGQNRAFSHHFRTTRNSENFLTTCLTTVGAEANRLVASAPVRSAKKTKFKRFPEIIPPRTFFFVYCVSVFIFSFVIHQYNRWAAIIDIFHMQAIFIGLANDSHGKIIGCVTVSEQIWN